jgi:hypothetical protein
VSGGIKNRRHILRIILGVKHIGLGYEVGERVKDEALMSELVYGRCK